MTIHFSEKHTVFLAVLLGQSLSCEPNISMKAAKFRNLWIIYKSGFFSFRLPFTVSKWLNDLPLEIVMTTLAIQLYNYSSSSWNFVKTCYQNGPSIFLNYGNFYGCTFYKVKWTLSSNETYLGWLKTAFFVHHTCTYVICTL